MRIETTKDIIKHFRKFHRIIAAYWHNLSVKSEKERVKLLLNYLKEREDQIEKTLSEIENSSSNHILNSWFSHSHCEAKLEELSQIVNNESPTVDEVIERFLQMDNCLIELYSELVESAENIDVQDFLENLSTLEKNHRDKVIKNASQYEDF